MSVEASFAILDEQYAEHAPVGVFLMFSGGHDSLTATHVGARWAQARDIPFSVAHINTGIGIEQTRTFVRETCSAHEWELLELHADRVEQTYEYIVHKYGFPGPGGHPYMYRRLKERKVERLVREAKIGYPRSSRVFLVSGMRRSESARRMRHADFQRRRGAQVWLSPIEHWSKSDCNAYIAENELTRNVVTDVLHFSGECICGAYSPIGQREEIFDWYPETGAYLRKLERELEAEGHISCVWGYAARYTTQQNPGQGHLFSPLCVGCEQNAYPGNDDLDF